MDCAVSRCFVGKENERKKKSNPHPLQPLFPIISYKGVEGRDRPWVWEVEVHSVVSVGGGLGVALPSIVCGDDGRGSCVWRWGLSGTSLWLQHESTFGVLPCVGWVETA